MDPRKGRGNKAGNTQQVALSGLHSTVRPERVTVNGSQSTGYTQRVNPYDSAQAKSTTINQNQPKEPQNIYYTYLYHDFYHYNPFDSLRL